MNEKQLVKVEQPTYDSKNWRRADRLSWGFVSTVMKNDVLETFQYKTGALIHATSVVECRKWRSIPDVTFIGKGKWEYR